MTWIQSAPELPRSFGAAPVPDIEALRRAALQASWRRDRRVAQRRMAMRWIAWYTLRGLPLLAIAAGVMLWLSNRPAGRPAGQSPAAVTMPLKPVPPQVQPGEVALQLRLESPLQPLSPAANTAATAQAASPQSSGVPLADRAAPATDSPSPQLKPDNWLHSQEP
jgi:hypothetical protein